MIIDFQEVFAVHLSIFILSLLSIKLFKLPLNKYFILYTIFAVINYSIHALVFENYTNIPLIISYFAGILFVFLLSGIFGTRVNSSNYSSLMSVVAFFPWYLGIKNSLFFILSLIAITLLYAFIKEFRAKNKFDISKTPRLKIKEKLSEEDYLLFKKHTVLIFVYPFLITGVLIGLAISGF